MIFGLYTNNMFSFEKLKTIYVNVAREIAKVC